MKTCRYLNYMLKIKKQTRIAFAAGFWILALVCMICIFLFSHQTGDESKELSEGVLSFLLEILGDFLNSFIVRKFAHFFEYMALAFCFSGAFFFTRKRFSPAFSFAGSLLYSISDEIHQYFVPERACRVFDIFVDSCGAVVGILIFAGFLALLNFIIMKRESKTE